MKKTCLNCKYFHEELRDDNYHIHNYCECLDKVFPLGPMYCPLNSFLNENTNEVQYANPEYTCCTCIWDDIEIGEAYCYRFIPKSKDSYSEEFFKERYDSNKKLALKAIETMLDENSKYDFFKGREDLSKEDIEYLKDLYDILQDNVEGEK